MANAAAIGAKAKEMSVTLRGREWTQTVGGPQKYHAKSLAVLQKKFAALSCSRDSSLGKVLHKVGIYDLLLPGKARL